jgi:hypothetical protein
MGLSGKASLKKKIIVNHIGDKDPNFSSEIDNFLGLYKVDNMLIAPFLDKTGEVRGVIQLINKIGKPKIPDQDEIEI